MKKRKFSWLLNVATISLSLCAIVIGIFALKTASLSINGSIGFKAKQCIVQVSGSYSAYVTTTSTERKTTTLDTTIVGGDNNEASKEIKDLSLFFSNYATDGHGDEIVFNLTITNKSDFKITVKAPAPKLTTTSTASVTYTSSNEKFTLEKDASKEIILTYKLENIDYADDITDGKFSISLNFEKWVWSQYYNESITEKFYIDSAWKDVTTTKLCTTMGHSIVGTGDGTDGETPVDIQWYAFAVKGVDTGKGYVYNNTWYANGTNNGNLSERWYSLNGINFNDNLEMVLTSGNVSAKGQTFWFIQQYVTAGGYYMSDYSGSHVSGVRFDSSNNNYQASSIYTYLTTNDNGNYLSLTGIKNDSLYNSITTRSVNESYKVTFEADYTSTDKDSGGKYTYTSTFSSKLWLISASELGLITNKETDYTKSGKAYGTMTTGIGNKVLSNSYSGFAADWWLRSPDEQWNDQARAGTYDGYLGGYIVNYNDEGGVRAAFQISIPK